MKTHTHTHTHTRNIFGNEPRRKKKLHLNGKLLGKNRFFFISFFSIKCEIDDFIQHK